MNINQHVLSIVARATLCVLSVSAITLHSCDGHEPSVSAERWPGFLGVGSTAIDPATLPLEWTPTSNVSWQTKLVGTGQSSPLIWDDKVFVTSIDGTMKEDCHVTAVSLSDGKKLWDYKTKSPQPVRSNYFQSRSAPTPAVDAERVYAFFETGTLVALTHDGTEVWQRRLTDEFGEFEVSIGLASSVAQTEDSVFVLVDHEGPSYLLAVDKKTGETKWQTERFPRSSYASPIVLTISGQPQIVVSSSGSVDGYDPVDGRLLWTMEGIGGNRSTTPMLYGENRFLISASPGMHDERIKEARESNFAMQIEKTGDTFTPKVLWKVKKAMPSFGSPIVHQGLAYWVNNVGVLYCFDVETGEPVYTKRSGQLCWATPLALGDHIYLFGKDGLTTVIAAGREFKVIAKNELIDGATEVGEADVKRREERAHQHDSDSRDQPDRAGSKAESATADDSSERPGSESGRPSRGTETAGEGRPGRPAGADESKEGSGRPSSRGGRAFAEPIQYGYAVVNGSLVMRTGGNVYCIRKSPNASVDSTKVSAAEGTEQ